jgi:hypothetical protein
MNFQTLRVLISIEIIMFFIGIYLIKTKPNYKIKLIDKIKLNNRLLIWTAIALIIIAAKYILYMRYSTRFILGTVTLTILTISIYAYERKDAYGKGGWLYRWYNANYKYLGKQWIRDIYKLLIDHKLIDLKSKDEFVFISPSANKGKYEKDLFELTNQDRKNNIFIISDLEKIENHECSSIGNNIKSRYIYMESKDAADIKNTIKAAGQSKVDIIWDIKGCIWHRSTSKQVHELKEVLKNYHEVLKDNGVLIIDNVPYPYIIICNLIYYTCGIVLGTSEVSTYSKIRTLIKNSGNGLNELVNELFDIEYLESCSNKNVKLVVFKKKNMKPQEMII